VEQVKSTSGIIKIIFCFILKQIILVLIKILALVYNLRILRIMTRFKKNDDKNFKKLEKIIKKFKEDK